MQGYRTPDTATLPKVDLHVHGEAFGRTLQVLARRRAYREHDQRPFIAEATRDLPPGLSRLSFLDAALGRGWPSGDVAPGHYAEMDDQPDHLEARYAALMEEAAANGALHIEVRVGGESVFYPHFMSSFRAAEARVRRQHPGFGAEALVAWQGRGDIERLESRVKWTLEAAREGLRGVDLYPGPYEAEADFSTLYRWAEKAARAGLGITCHAGEFSTANLKNALAMPGLTRLGHAVFAPRVPGLVGELARRGIIVEVQLTCNLVLGAISSLDEHPIRRFLDAGVRVTLGSDDPLRVGTNIGREYELAAGLGFSLAELTEFTRTGIEAAFVTEARRKALLDALARATAAPGDQRSASRKNSSTVSLNAAGRSKYVEWPAPEMTW